jgi:hypothetical protein
MTAANASGSGHCSDRHDFIGGGDAIERGALQRQRQQPRGRAPRQRQADAAALRHGDKVKARQPQRIGDAQHVIGFGGKTGGGDRLAKAAAIDTDEGVICRQRQLRPPHPPIERPAVQQQHGWPGAGALDSKPSARHGNHGSRAARPVRPWGQGRCHRRHGSGDQAAWRKGLLFL